MSIKSKAFLNDYQTIEQTLQRVMWIEKKRFSQLLAALDLTLSQFLVLASIRQRGTGCPIGSLADEMFQSYPTMTGIVDRLESAKLVVRERGNDHDRRKVVVNLTPTGRELLERAQAARQERMLQAFGAFSARERRELVRLLTIYLDTLEKEP
jgi:DNA-binding MarR family transcriptional regulator